MKYELTGDLVAGAVAEWKRPGDAQESLARAICYVLDQLPDPVPTLRSLGERPDPEPKEQVRVYFAVGPNGRLTSASLRPLAPDALFLDFLRPVQTPEAIARDEFEEQWRTHNTEWDFHTNSQGEYQNPHTRGAFEGFKLGRKSAA